ncbi:hypothetical protein B0T22DRAFT_420368 [Podospora appendiculata]|uniref:Carrier domain-containing protein n=1 Tax=Podospora appendiculata TaxID=314037 RepID=A0AAE0XH85_9PEZI|nr:hypothetical protein B0T22DRAFT_420368 [Podospora appendiculata]
MQSLPNIVDTLAAEVPDNVWVKVPLSSLDGPEDEDLVWDDVTWRQLSRAVDTMAHWIDLHLGPLATKGETVAYMGVNDIRYPIVILATLKTGYTSLLTSPRNSQQGHSSLLTATSCHKFLYTDELQPAIQSITTTHLSPIKALQIPSLRDLLNPPSSQPPYPNTTPSPSEQDTTLILHSSGTTGLPKPVHIKAGTLNIIPSILSMPTPPGRVNMHEVLYRSPLMLSAAPMFHVMGLNLLLRSLYHQGPLVLLPPGQPPTAPLLIRAIAATNPTSMIAAPSLLEAMASTPAGLAAVSTLEHTLFGGAPLSPSAGNVLAKVTTLVNGLGSTEIFMAASLVPLDPVADWEYLEWNPAAGMHMQPTHDGTSDSHELVVRHLPDPRYQFVFCNFPRLDEWRTRDLFVRHPQREGLWRYVGRVDDVLVLSNGEKMNPVAFEKAVESHATVKGAVVVGAGKFQVGLILEVEGEGEEEDREGILDEVWPCVEEANMPYPAHARVWRTMVRLAVEGKPFVRGAKGSVLRRKTWEVYEREIGEMYDQEAVVEKEGENEEMLEIVRKAVREVMAARKDEVTDEQNLFHLGMDSLQVLQLSQVLGRRCRHVSQAQAFRMIYDQPSIERLTRAITAAGSKLGGTHPVETSSREEKMSRMVHTYSRELPRASTTLATHGNRPSPDGLVVVLTGSTGSLGSYVLHRLIENNQVAHVYCLNRTADGAERQARAFSDRGLGPINFLVTAHPKVTFLHADLAEERFGLEPATYQKLQQRTDVVLLNAWPVNFNSPLDGFESAVAGTRRCVDFAASATRRPHVVFVSSIASVLNYPAVRLDTTKTGDGNDGVVTTSIPEEFELDNSLPLKQGYGESKHVASSILANAARVSGVGVTILRAGQLAGPVDGQGVWNRQEWLPSLIATSKSLGKIPASLGAGDDVIDWLPVDLAAGAILDLSLVHVPGSGNPALDCFNLVNPRTNQWSVVAQAVREFYADCGVSIDVVSYDEWLDDLMAVHAGGVMTGDQVERYPALKLVEFFQEKSLKGAGAGGRVTFATERIVEQSLTMAGVAAVNGEMVKRWLSAWAF